MVEKGCIGNKWAKTASLTLEFNDRPFLENLIISRLLKSSKIANKDQFLLQKNEVFDEPKQSVVLFLDY